MPEENGFLVFGVSNAKYLAFDTPDGNALRWETPDGNALRWEDAIYSPHLILKPRVVQNWTILIICEIRLTPNGPIRNLHDPMSAAVEDKCTCWTQTRFQWVEWQVSPSKNQLKPIQPTPTTFVHIFAVYI